MKFYFILFIMDNYGKKGRENAVDSYRAVSLLVENIEKAVKEKGSHRNECPELKELMEKFCDSSVCEAFCASHGVTHLVKRKILNASPTMSSLISLLPTITHYSPLVTSIGNILFFSAKEEINTTGKYDCQYNFTNKSHPFVVVLKQNCGKSWNAIYTYIEFIFKGDNDNELIFSNEINVLRPFFLFVFCDPTSNSFQYKNELFSLLIEQREKTEAKKLLIQGLTWQKIDLNFCRLIRKICRKLMSSPDGDNGLILSSLTPFIGYVIKWLVINAHNPTLWINLLSECIRIDSAGAGSVLYILSDVLLHTPSLFVNELVELCKYIIQSSPCNRYVVQKFVAVSLIWMVNPSSLADPLFHNLENIFKFVRIKMRLNDWREPKISISDNPYFEISRNSFSEVKVAVEMTELSDKWKSGSSVLNWLKRLNASTDSAIQTSFVNFLFGIFLFENEDEILEMSSEKLLTLSNGDGELSFHLICLIFLKLCREVEPRRQLKCLQSLVKMGFVKENVPFIIGILETLKKDQTTLMLPVVIDLYLKLWKANNRIYSYLHKTLFSSGDSSWEVNVMKAIAMREICRTCPETYGKSLVSKLSDVLNDCGNCSSGTPSAIAIEAVIELCKASVTDISGAWRALKPKLSCDRRRKVVISLCNLFGEVPSLSGAERDALTIDIVPRLWSYAFSDDIQIVKASLRALAKFGGETYGPRLLPDCLKSDLEVPRHVIKQSGEVSRQELLDELEYVPGECWVELIQRVDSRALRDAEDVIESLIQQELNSLPRRFFCHPEEAAEPANYNHLPHSSICRALVFHVRKYSDASKMLPDSVIQSLRILSRDYSKCLPVLDWSFLEKFFNFGEDCKRYSVTILAKQGAASRAGRKVFENYITENVSRFKDVNDFIFLYEALPFVCSNLTVNSLIQFLTRTISNSLIHSLKCGTDHFEMVLNNSKVTLESKLVPDTRKAILLSRIQTVLTEIPPEHSLMEKYAEFLAELPRKTVESLTSPSSWSKITSDRIRRSIHIVKKAAFHPESTNPLEWFNECIDGVFNLPSEHDFVIDSISEVLRRKKNLNHSRWLTELMWIIQSSTSSADSIDSIKVTLFLLNIFITCTIILSGYECLLSDFEGDSYRKAILRLFPISLYRLLELQDYSSLSPKVIEWVHVLSKWKNLREEYVEAFEQSILILRNNKFCSEKNKWLQLFYLPAMKF